MFLGRVEEGVKEGSLEHFSCCTCPSCTTSPPPRHRAHLTGHVTLEVSLLAFCCCYVKGWALDTTLKHLTSETRDEQQLFPLEVPARLLWTEPVNGPPCPIHYKQQRCCFTDKVLNKHASVLAVF
jgi:hypothetical protein